VRDAFDHCERLARRHYENFPVASRFLPRALRPHVAAVYAFARTADDFADEPGMTPAERIEALNDWAVKLEECYRGNVTHPVFVALRETVQRFDLPSDLFHALLHAFRLDVTKHRYETFEELLEYCRFSAHPVGRIVLLLFNYRNESLMNLSDHICTALQLTNFWQDLSVDILRDRLYLPTDDLVHCGVTEEEIFNRSHTPEFAQLLAMEVDRTEELFIRGEPLLTWVGNDLSRELRLTLAGGRRVLEKIRRRNYEVLSRRPTLSLADKISIVAQVLFQRAS
jgi:squalene synthase HpnC